MAACSKRLPTLVIGLALAAAFGWLVRLALQGDEIRFLSPHRNADWILYPVSPAAYIHRAEERTADFRRTFTLGVVPEAATLELWAFKHCHVVLNGDLVAPNP